MRRTLIIDLEYNANDTPESEIDALLHNIPNHLAGNGMFSGDLDAEVASWDYVVITDELAGRTPAEIEQIGYDKGHKTGADKEFKSLREWLLREWFLQRAGALWANNANDTPEPEIDAQNLPDNT